MLCHSERPSRVILSESEGSQAPGYEILRFTQNDKGGQIRHSLSVCLTSFCFA